MEAGPNLPKLVPTYASAATEDLLTGAQRLRRAFLEAPQVSASREGTIIAADAVEPPALMISRGVAYCASCAPDGRRTIMDILLPTDIVGLDHAVLGRSNRDIVAATMLGYRVLSGAKLRELLRDAQIALFALTVAGQTRWRQERHLMAVTRFDARGRLASMILGVYERLRRANLISRPTFNLPLTQEQVADYLGLTMVHVSRTLRRMREERLVLVDRQVVIILDLDALRRAAAPLTFAFNPAGDAGADGAAKTAVGRV